MILCKCSSVTLITGIMHRLEISKSGCRIYTKRLYGIDSSSQSFKKGPILFFYPVNDQKRTHIGQKWQKEWCYHTFVKEWIKALDKTRILAPSDYFYHFSFPSYGRLKSKTNFSNVFLRSCSLIPLIYCS